MSELIVACVKFDKIQLEATITFKIHNFAIQKYLILVTQKWILIQKLFHWPYISQHNHYASFHDNIIASETIAIFGWTLYMKYRSKNKIPKTNLFVFHFKQFIVHHKWRFILTHRKLFWTRYFSLLLSFTLQFNLHIWLTGSINSFATSKFTKPNS